VCIGGLDLTLVKKSNYFFIKPLLTNFWSEQYFF
jgi:hypothetical protein